VQVQNYFPTGTFPRPPIIFNVLKEKETGCVCALHVVEMDSGVMSYDAIIFQTLRNGPAALFESHFVQAAEDANKRIAEQQGIVLHDDVVSTKNCVVINSSPFLSVTGCTCQLKKKNALHTRQVRLDKIGLAEHFNVPYEVVCQALCNMSRKRKSRKASRS
jgi:hypothetical protein